MKKANDKETNTVRSHSQEVLRGVKFTETDSDRWGQGLGEGRCSPRVQRFSFTGGRVVGGDGWWGRWHSHTSVFPTTELCAEDGLRYNFTLCVFYYNFLKR